MIINYSKIYIMHFHFGCFLLYSKPCLCRFGCLGIFMTRLLFDYRFIDLSFVCRLTDRFGCLRDRLTFWVISFFYVFVFEVIFSFVFWGFSCQWWIRIVWSFPIVDAWNPIAFFIIFRFVVLYIWGIVIFIFDDGKCHRPGLLWSWRW